MQNYNDDTNQNTCTCDHYLPPTWLVQSPAFNLELAAFYKQLGLSGDGIVDFVLNELYFYHEGDLFDHQKIFVDVEADEYAPENVFGRSPRRSITRYLDRARNNYFYRLQRRMIPMVMMMYFAKEIYLYRTQGACAKSKNS